MVFTIENSISKARKNVQHLQKEKTVISIGDVWSIKKILILDFYFPSFKSICSKKYGFTKWFYADPFCGSGLIKFKDKDLSDEIFPGSALMGAFCAAENDYSGCFISDNNKTSILALNSRLKASPQLKGTNFRSSVKNFDDAVNTILKYKHFGIAFLVFIDPAAYIPIKWKLMEKLIEKTGIDVIFNFMTYSIALNISASKKHPGLNKNLNEFFGDENWKAFRRGLNRKNIGEKALQYYLKKIKFTSGKNTFKIGIFKEKNNKLYDMIVITRSPAGGRVITKCQDIMRKTSTETIKKLLKILADKQKTLLDYPGFGQSLSNR